MNRWTNEISTIRVIIESAEEGDQGRRMIDQSGTFNFLTLNENRTFSDDPLASHESFNDPHLVWRNVGNFHFPFDIPVLLVDYIDKLLAVHLEHGFPGHRNELRCVADF